MKQNRTLLTVFLFLMSLGLFAATPIEGLLERIDKGASRKIMTETVSGDADFFEITSRDGKPLVRGNNFVSIASGINWYL